MNNYIIASVAGSGKTTRLLQHINKLLADGVNPNRILLISYTNATCDDINRRSNAKAMTFHAFALLMINTKKHLEESIEYLLHPLRDKYEELFSIFSAGELANMIMNYEPHDNYENLTEAELRINLSLANLYGEIEDIKKIKGIIVFSDLIRELANNLSEVMLDIFQLYDHICIDEAQDLSILQLYIVEKIITNVFMEENKSFFVVGDAEQSIYDFTGASKEGYLTFLSNLERAAISNKRVLITENRNKTYRFGGQILQEINRRFLPHRSEVAYGRFESYCVTRSEFFPRVENIVESYLYSYLPEQILILFAYNNSLVQQLQSKINVGFNSKIWLNNNVVYGALEDIYHYLLTKHSYYGVKVLQGIFFAHDQFHIHVHNYMEKYEEILIHLEKYTTAEGLMRYLSTRITYLSSSDLLVFKELYTLSLSFRTFYSFFLQLPECLSIEEKGINFSTIHGAKGLESPLVIFIDFIQIRTRPHRIQLQPYLIYCNKNILTTSNCLYYVAFTRAQEHMVHLVITD